MSTPTVLAANITGLLADETRLHARIGRWCNRDTRSPLPGTITAWRNDFVGHGRTWRADVDRRRN